MGLFFDAITKYQGSFYRNFSQAIGENDLKNFFPNEAVAEYGVCAGCCLDWIEHYLKTPHILYSNDDLIKNKHEIVSTQRAVRYLDISLDDVLISFGLQPLPGIALRKSVHLSSYEAIIHRISLNNCIFTVGYCHPDFGNHVTCGFVDASKKLFFFDANKGDVFIPKENSAAWLCAYCKIFIRTCGFIRISCFATQYDPDHFSEKHFQLAKQAVNFTVPGGIQSKTRDDLSLYLPRHYKKLL